MASLDLELQKRLNDFNQPHLLRHFESLTGPAQQRFADQLTKVDFELLQNLWSSTDTGEDWQAVSLRAEAPPAIRLDTTKNPIQPAEARQRGEAALRAGEVGMVLAAGGQGTRLGFDAPKGTFSIGPLSKASLFQIFIEKLLATRIKYGANLPLFVMTSPATHEPTVAYLAENNYFGLPQQDVTVFCQGTMPAVDAETGKLLIASPGELALSPDGHGGMLSAMVKNGVLDTCQQRGVKQLFYLQIDNPLVEACDPTFLGYHLLSESEMTTQVIAKQDPLERVGNFVIVDGQTRIIEYSDLPESAAKQTNADGSLKIWAGSIGVHAIDVAFLQRAAANRDSLPFHRAHKKAAYLDEQGQLISPAEPNALKFERFIFDLLPQAKNAIAVEVDEQRVFAPVKNASGAPKDTPESVKAQMCRLYRTWLRGAGAKVSDTVEIEISPLYALEPEDLKGKLPEGIELTVATYFR